MVNRIACFLTCGYTEAGAMQSFLRKINDNYEFRQFLPNKTIKKKGMSKDDRMLRNINPKMVADNCRKYFAPVYYKLCNF